MPHVDYEIMSEKSYSNCPLKKRPVQIVSRDEFVGCDVEDRGNFVYYYMGAFDVLVN